MEKVMKSQLGIAQMLGLVGIGNRRQFDSLHMMEVAKATDDNRYYGREREVLADNLRDYLVIGDDDVF